MATEVVLRDPQFKANPYPMLGAAAAGSSGLSRPAESLEISGSRHGMTMSSQCFTTGDSRPTGGTRPCTPPGLLETPLAGLRAAAEEHAQ
jgi:hypothetical protein